MRLTNYIISLLSIVLFLGCSGTQNIPEGDLLYVGNTITIEKNKESKKKLKK